jgi:hypothetical protein
MGFIDAILAGDMSAPRKQRHIAARILPAIAGGASGLSGRPSRGARVCEFPQAATQISPNVDGVYNISGLFVPLLCVYAATNRCLT